MPLPFERPPQHIAPPHEALMTSLQEIEWLARCGRPDPPTTCWPLELVPSWSEAIRCVGSAAWSRFRRARRDELRAHVSAGSPGVFGEWDLIETAARRWTEANVVSVLADALPPQVGLDDVAGEVEWDVVAFMLESIFASLRPPEFHRELMRVYRAGHLPCGWRGDFPGGVLLAF